MLTTAQSPLRVDQLDSTLNAQQKVSDFLNTSGHHLEGLVPDPLDLSVGHNVEVESDETRKRKKKEAKREKKRTKRAKEPVPDTPVYKSFVPSSGSPRVSFLRKKEPLPAAIEFSMDPDPIETQSVASSLSVGDQFKPSASSSNLPAPVRIFAVRPTAPAVPTSQDDDEAMAWAVTDAAARLLRDGAPPAPLGGRVVLNDLVHRRECFSPVVSACCACCVDHMFIRSPDCVCLQMPEWRRSSARRRRRELLEPRPGDRRSPTRSTSMGRVLSAAVLL